MATQNSKYIVYADYANLKGITESKKENMQTYQVGDGSVKTQSIPRYMFKRGQVIELDLSKLTRESLLRLCMLENSFAVIRLDTDYNKQAKSEGLETDLYKIQINNESKFYNTQVPQSVINEFCQAWEDKKAYIPNPFEQTSFTRQVDKFYMNLIETNNK